MTAPTTVEMTIVDPIRVRRELVDLEEQRLKLKQELDGPYQVYRRDLRVKELNEIQDQQRQFSLQMQWAAEAQDADVAAKAWAVVDQVTGEIRHADAKAGFAAGVQLAVLGTVVAGAAGIGGPLRTVAGALLLAAVALAAAAVLPRLPHRMTASEGAADWLQFGAVGKMHPNELAKWLSSDTRTADAACMRAVALSKIAHRKHLLVRSSILTGLAGVLAAAIAAVAGSW